MKRGSTCRPNDIDPPIRNCHLKTGAIALSAFEAHAQMEQVHVLGQKASQQTPHCLNLGILLAVLGCSFRAAALAGGCGTPCENN